MLYYDYMRKKLNGLNKNGIDCEFEGYPCSFSGKVRRIRNYQIYGDSTQKTRSGKNLLHTDVTTSTLNGVTLTYDNGTITLNGTCTASANFELGDIVLSAGTYTLSANANKIPVSNDYAFVQLHDATNNQTIQIDNSNALSSTTITTSLDGTFAYRIRVDEGTAYDNVILKPQLEVGSTATEYEQYGVMPSPEFPSDIESVGDLTTKNLWSFGDVAFTRYKKIVLSQPLPAGQYVFRAYIESTDTDAQYSLIRMSDADDNDVAKIGFYFFSKEYTRTFAASATISCIELYASDNYVNGAGDYCTFTNVQLEKGSMATEYEPYHKYKIPIKISGKNLLSKWYGNTYYANCTKSKAIYMEPGTYNYHFERADDTVTKWRYAMSIFDVNGGNSDRLTNVNQYLAPVAAPNGWYCNNYGVVQTNADIACGDSANVALTILKPCYIMFMLQTKDSSGTILDAKTYAKNVILEKGEQYTGYEDYTEPITTNIYTDEPLRKVGNYADYIDYKNQKVVRKIEVLDDTGTKTIDESLGTFVTPTEESIYLPPLSTIINGTNIITTNTAVEPSNIKIKYKE